MGFYDTSTDWERLAAVVRGGSAHALMEIISDYEKRTQSIPTAVMASMLWDGVQHADHRILDTLIGASTPKELVAGWTAVHEDPTTTVGVRNAANDRLVSMSSDVYVTRQAKKIMAMLLAVDATDLLVFWAKQEAGRANPDFGFTVALAVMAVENGKPAVLEALIDRGVLPAAMMMRVATQLVWGGTVADADMREALVRLTQRRTEPLRRGLWVPEDAIGTTISALCINAGHSKPQHVDLAAWMIDTCSSRELEHLRSELPRIAGRNTRSAEAISAAVQRRAERLELEANTAPGAHSRSLKM